MTPLEFLKYLLGLIEGRHFVAISCNNMNKNPQNAAPVQWSSEFLKNGRYIKIRGKNDSWSSLSFGSFANFSEVAFISGLKHANRE